MTPQPLFIYPTSAAGVNHLPLFPPNSLSLSYTTPSSYHPLKTAGSKLTFVTKSSTSPVAFSNPSIDDATKLAQVAKRLENTSRYFKRLGGIGFWGQLIFTVVAAVILSFSIVVTSKITSPVTFYATAGGIVAAFISVFWSFGYIRLSEKLRKTANDPSKAPPRASVVKGIQNGIVMNLLGMASAILGMQATVGLLVANLLQHLQILFTKEFRLVLALFLHWMCSWCRFMAAFAFSGSVVLIAREFHKRLLSDFMKKIELELEVGGTKKCLAKKRVWFAKDVIEPSSNNKEYRRRQFDEEYVDRRFAGPADNGGSWMR